MRLQTFPRNGTVSNKGGTDLDRPSPFVVCQASLEQKADRRHKTIVCPTILLPSQSMDPSDRERYSRQILFPGIGERGQEALLDAHAVIAGCGALGSFHAAALARAGVRRVPAVAPEYGGATQPP